MTELKEGAKYRVTLEGIHIEGNQFRFKGDASTTGTWFTPEELAHAKIEELPND